jgi:hypothetical protein
MYAYIDYSHKKKEECEIISDEFADIRTDENESEIVRLFKNNIKPMQISEITGVHISTVYRKIKEIKDEQN